MKKTTFRITFTAIMIALSAVLSLVKLPVYTSTALDSLPGFFTAIFANPILGGVVALIGHLITGLMSGFPQTVLGHLFIAIGMFTSAYLFGLIFKKRSVLRIAIAIVIAIACNIYASFPFLHWFLQVPYSFLMTLQIPILIAASINIALAIILFFIFEKTKYRINI